MYATTTATAARHEKMTYYKQQRHYDLLGCSSCTWRDFFNTFSCSRLCFHESCEDKVDVIYCSILLMKFMFTFLTDYFHSLTFPLPSFPLFHEHVSNGGSLLLAATQTNDKCRKKERKVSVWSSEKVHFCFMLCVCTFAFPFRITCSKLIRW